MDTREDDIWVCSYPRSGTTLTQQIVSLVMTLVFKAATTVQLDERFPQVDIIDERYPYFKGVKYVEQLPSSRRIKCHLHLFLLPEQLRKGKGRIIYIARNPKDVVVSWYHVLEWTDELGDTLDTWDTFLDSFVDGTGIQTYSLYNVICKAFPRKCTTVTRNDFEELSQLCKESMVDEKP